MIKISHNDAIKLENIVASLFKSNRYGICGLCSADFFETEPLAAAIMVVSYIYAREMVINEDECEKFLSKYRIVFKYPEDNDVDNEVNNYVNGLKEIVGKYVTNNLH